MRVERAKKVYVPVTIILEEEQDFETFRKLMHICTNTLPGGAPQQQAAILWTALVHMQ